MNIKHLTFTCVLSIALCAPVSALATVIVGELDEDDFLGIDSTGDDFYYDLFEVTVLGTSTITITLETGEFAPFVTWGIDLGLPEWPVGSDEPYASFIDFDFSTTPGAVSIPVDGLAIDQTFDVLVSTIFYNPTDLGAYTLTFDGDVTVQQVPAPPTLALLGLGLFGMGLFRHMKA